MTLSNDKKDEEINKDVCPFDAFTTSKEFAAYNHGLNDNGLFLSKLNKNKKYSQAQLINILHNFQKKIVEEMEGHKNYKKAMLQKHTKESIRDNRKEIDTKIREWFKAVQTKISTYRNLTTFNEQKIIKRLFDPSAADYVLFGELEQASNAKQIVSDYIYLEKPMDEICYIFLQNENLYIGRIKKRFDKTGQAGERFGIDVKFSIKDEESNGFYITKRQKQGDGDLSD